MWRWSLAFGVSVALAFLFQLAIPFVQSMSAAGVASLVLTCVVISVPFVCSGVVVALALTRFQRVNRLYAADLIGAGLGCVALVVVFQWLDGPSLVIGIAATACAWGRCCWPSPPASTWRRWPRPWCSWSWRRPLSSTSTNTTRATRSFRILWAKEEQDTLHAMDKWNAFSITVDGAPTDIGWPAGYGMSRTLREIVVPQMSMLIDGTAGTMITGYDGSDERTDFLRYDVTNLGYYGLDDGFEMRGHRRGRRA